ncbi:competence protein CoiA [Enterococcus hermanniensis]|uniref:Competence protein CoiA-like family protein n=1 Tax=Enterococcus hermanniensis TaxID=249189 RepID=A0A1L8TNU2_9ENTE|nr:competence protein CoiA family protein [Enterococcus hermanniensis]OJG45989.1 hypothetical protein RV04_GL001755 [Enterococcus hermanniensis]
MLFAFTKEKQLVDASGADARKTYYCPDCGSVLIRKAGKLLIPHFAHTANENCQGMSEGETAEHLNLKKIFYQWGRQDDQHWKLEEPLKDLPQRPDLLNQKLVVEIQCSPLKTSRLEERVSGYRQMGYQDWWLLGRKLCPDKKFTALQKQFCSFSKARGVHLWGIKAGTITLFYHIYQRDQHYHYSKKSWPKYSEPLPMILNTTIRETPPKVILSKQSVIDKKTHLGLKLRQSDPKIRKIQDYLYHRYEHLLYLSDWLYFPSRYFFFYQDDILIFRLLFQQEAKNADRIFKKFLLYREKTQQHWSFCRIAEREILERLYLEAIFCQRKAKILLT